MSHLIACPDCKKQLQVPDDLIGKSVQCPECQHTFSAETLDQEVITSTPSKPANLPVPIKKRSAWDKQDDDDEVVKKRPRKSDYDDDDDDERSGPRRSGRRRAIRHGAPHRGGMILAFGIIALVSGLGIIFGPIAWM